MRLGVCVLLLGTSLFGQSVRFEIADVHASPKAAHPAMRMAVLAPNVYQIRTATMVELIVAAYGVDAEKVIAGPSWLQMDRFDVIAKAPTGATQQVVRMMLQTLLAERFALTVHPDSRLN